MDLSYLNTNNFPMEKVFINVVPLSSFIVIGLVNYFLIHTILNCPSKLCKFYSELQSIVKYHLRLLNHYFKPEFHKKKQLDFEWISRRQSSSAPAGEKIDNDSKMCSEEVEMVMGSLGIFFNPEGEKLHGRFGSEDVYKFFEEKEPSFEEVKGAFDVFDGNKDGFIDERELQRVLCALGFKEGSDMGNCRRMIGVFDEDGDGKINFTEFLKFMENTVC